MIAGTATSAAPVIVTGVMNACRNRSVAVRQASPTHAAISVS
jgi:hypothetical protein